MAFETSLGGEGKEFPQTRWSAILSARTGSGPKRQEALEELCRRYWKPVYAYVRSGRSVENEAAKDLTQEFFVELVEGKLLERYSPERGSFRKYLRGAVQLFLLESRRKARALRRGGGKELFRLDEARDVSALVSAKAVDPQEAFDRQWANGLVDAAVEEVREELLQEGRKGWIEILDRHELHPPPDGAPGHEALAKELRVSKWEINHCVVTCRRRMREKIREHIRDYVQFENEVEEELACLFPR